MFGITARRKWYGIDWYWRGSYRGTFGHIPIPYVIVKLRGDNLRIIAWHKRRLRVIEGTHRKSED